MCVSLKIRVAVIFLLGSVGVFSTSLLASPLDPHSVKQPEMTDALLTGKRIYESKCAKCHGINAAGTNKGPTFLHRVYHPGHHGDAAFFFAVERGTKQHHWPFGDMPPVPGVTDEQVKSIIRYIRALQDVNGIF